MVVAFLVGNHDFSKKGSSRNGLIDKDANPITAKAIRIDT